MFYSITVAKKWLLNFQHILQRFFFFFLFIEAMIAPEVEIVDITPLSLRAQWTDINAEVDSWVVAIRRHLMESINGDEEENAPIKVCSGLKLAKHILFPKRSDEITKLPSSFREIN